MHKVGIHVHVRRLDHVHIGVIKLILIFFHNQPLRASESGGGGATRMSSIFCLMKPSPLTQDGGTSLMYASFKGQPQVLLSLLQHGANPNLINNVTLLNPN